MFRRLNRSSFHQSCRKPQEELELSYAATVELLEAHRSVIARRSNRGLRRFTVDDWKQLHEAIKRVFG